MSRFRYFIPALLTVLLVLAAGTLGFGSEEAETESGDRGIIIRNNDIQNSGFGVYVGPRDDRLTIVSNLIKNNGEGVRLTGVKSRNVVRNNDIVDNVLGISLRDRYSHNEKGYIDYPVDPEDIVISGNRFESNSDGNVLNLLRDLEIQQEKTSEGSPEETSGEKAEGNQPEEETDSETNTETNNNDLQDTDGSESTDEEVKKKSPIPEANQEKPLLKQNCAGNTRKQGRDKLFSRKRLAWLENTADNWRRCCRTGRRPVICFVIRLTRFYNILTVSGSRDPFLFVSRFQ